MSERIEVKYMGLKVKISTVKSVKDGVVCTSYQVSDYSSEKRKRWTYADLQEAKAKAREIPIGLDADSCFVLLVGQTTRPQRFGNCCPYEHETETGHSFIVHTVSARNWRFSQYGFTPPGCPPAPVPMGSVCDSKDGV